MAPSSISWGDLTVLSHTKVMSPGYSSPWGDLAVLALMYKSHVPGDSSPHTPTPGSRAAQALRNDCVDDLGRAVGFLDLLNLSITRLLHPSQPASINQSTCNAPRAVQKRAVIPASSLLAGCGPGAAGVAASRTHATRAPRGWRVGSGDPGGCGLGWFQYAWNGWALWRSVEECG